jgi:murein DD-endopeptidase MepM/ murein hydrolase activator NlpD
LPVVSEVYFMSKIKYKFNTKSLTYEKVQLNWRQVALRVLSYFATGGVFALGVMLFNLVESPNEKMQKRELEELRLQYDLLSKRISNLNTVLADLQQRDDNIYRMIFEAEPIPDNVRKAGFGGVERYKELQGYENSILMVEATKKLDLISKQMYVQSKSYDELVKLVKNKKNMLASIPAIMPINSKKLRHQPAGFGWRTHPIYKLSQFHPGMDFAVPTNSEIYATGDGVVERADNTAQGYGNHVVINHGYGYKTLYGHMAKFIVYPGQKVKRGQVIGYVGSTGLSTAPHVHYEVMKNGEKVNPVNFYYNDLTPAEYQELIEVSSKASQSFD